MDTCPIPPAASGLFQSEFLTSSQGRTFKIDIKSQAVTEKFHVSALLH